MEPNTLIVVALLVGVIVASLIGIILSRGSSAKVEELECTFEATLKHSKEVEESNAMLAGQVERLNSEKWCNENRPKMLDLKELQ
jgi:hypothetical protein